MMESSSDVSRETHERLRAFEAIAEKWTARINLVSKRSANDIWRRHIRDSIQIYRAGPENFKHWADLGSGGGFPGVVVAIMAHGSSGRVTMVESDSRKCAFLRAALRATGVQADVLNDRIEVTEALQADIVSARALADLGALLRHAEQHLAPGGTAIFPKGASWRQEVEKARWQWNFDIEAVKSSLAPEAAILRISGVSRV